jgi:hypothetical protein
MKSNWHCHRTDAVLSTFGNVGHLSVMTSPRTTTANIGREQAKPNPYAITWRGGAAAKIVARASRPSVSKDSGSVETHGRDARATPPREKFAKENKTFMDGIDGYFWYDPCLEHGCEIQNSIHARRGIRKIESAI